MELFKSYVELNRTSWYAHTARMIVESYIVVGVPGRTMSSPGTYVLHVFPGTYVSKLALKDAPGGSYNVVGLQWYDGKNGYEEGDTYCLCIALDVGRLADTLYIIVNNIIFFQKPSPTIYMYLSN